MYELYALNYFVVVWILGKNSVDFTPHVFNKNLKYKLLLELQKMV